MKSDYRVRAYSFLSQIFPYIEDCLYDAFAVEQHVSVFNYEHSRKVKCLWGSARIALITSDYVIKWDYDKDCVNEIGGCDDEIRNYRTAKMQGYGYLFAETTGVIYHGCRFNIMPRVTNVENPRKKPLESYLTDEEWDWLTNFCRDLHSYNWGIRHGKACVIDYAWDETVTERGEWGD